MFDEEQDDLETYSFQADSVEDYLDLIDEWRFHAMHCSPTTKMVLDEADRYVNGSGWWHDNIEEDNQAYYAKCRLWNSEADEVHDRRVDRMGTFNDGRTDLGEGSTVSSRPSDEE